MEKGVYIPSTLAGTILLHLVRVGIDMTSLGKVAGEVVRSRAGT